jgi:hypothetical protein
MSFEPINLKTWTGRWQFQNAAGVGFEASGMEGRYELLLEAAADIERIAKQGNQLLTEFMKHEGSFELDSVEMREAPDDNGASLILRYGFTALSDPMNYFPYTYFDVAYRIGEPPSPRFWPVKFTVGFM